MLKQFLLQNKVFWFIQQLLDSKCSSHQHKTVQIGTECLICLQTLKRSPAKPKSL